MPEDSEPVDQHKDDRPEDTPVSEIWLERAIIRILRPVEPLGFHASVCIEQAKVKAKRWFGEGDDSYRRRRM